MTDELDPQAREIIEMWVRCDCLSDEQVTEGTDQMLNELREAGYAIAAMKPKDGLTWHVEQNAPDDRYPGQWQVTVTDGTRHGWGMHQNQDIAKSKAVLRMRENEVK